MIPGFRGGKKGRRINRRGAQGEKSASQTSHGLVGVDPHASYREVEGGGALLSVIGGTKKKKTRGVVGQQFGGPKGDHKRQDELC